MHTTNKNTFFEKMSFNMYMCYLLVFEKNRCWDKLILVTFHFRIKIKFLDKMIFLKTLNKHLKMKKYFFLKKNLKQTNLKLVIQNVFLRKKYRMVQFQFIMNPCEDWGEMTEKNGYLFSIRMHTEKYYGCSITSALHKLYECFYTFFFY